MIAETPFSLLLLAGASGYLLGSIPFGLILTRLGGAPDPRTIGSGNVGATNVLRTGRKGLAAATLAGDALKGTVAVLLAAPFGGGAALAAAAGAMLGHVFPPWLKFRGGKGVATYLGALAAVSWPAALVFAAAWLVTAGLTRYSSAAALAATLASPVALLALGRPAAALVFGCLTMLCWWKHQDNIRRLWAGTESRIGGSA